MQQQQQQQRNNNGSRHQRNNHNNNNPLNLSNQFDHQSNTHHAHTRSSLAETSEALAAELVRRRPADELVTKGILVSKHSARVAVAQKALVRQMDKDRLNAWMGSRPSIDQLLKVKSNLIEDTMTWTRQVQHGQQPMARNCHSMVSIASHNTLWLCGGYGTGHSECELLCLRLDDAVGSVWHRPFISGQPISERYSHTCSAVDSMLVLFGGLSVSGAWLNELQTLETAPHSDQDSHPSALQWVQPAQTGTPPSPRAAHSAAVIGTCIWVFGGNDGTNLFNDMFMLDTTDMRWTHIEAHGDPPTPRAGHTCNVINDTLLIFFAGATATGPTNDLYIFDTQTLTWSAVNIVAGSPPSPRAGHAACTVFGSRDLLVFAGGFISETHNDLHLFSLDSLGWQRPAVSGPVPIPRAGHSMIVINDTDRLLTFGGGDEDSVFNDCHILDTSFFRRSHDVSDIEPSVDGHERGSGSTSIPMPFSDSLNDLFQQFQADERQGELATNARLNELGSHLTQAVSAAVRSLDHRWQTRARENEEIRRNLEVIESRHNTDWCEMREEFMQLESLAAQTMRQARETVTAHNQLRHQALVEAINRLDPTRSQSHNQAQS